jgi:FdhD protein
VRKLGFPGPVQILKNRRLDSLPREDNKNIPEVSPELTAGFKALRVREGKASLVDERAARETPFEVRINGKSHTLLMINPSAVRELALGFCLSEGLISQPDQIEGIEVGSAEIPGLGKAWYADIKLPKDLARAAKVRRVAPAATSCGLCGLESFSQLGKNLRPVNQTGLTVEAKVLLSLEEAMVKAQPIYAATGGTHAALLGTPDGRVITVREDVGRHNALDKALGTGIDRGQDLSQCVAYLSGRVSYEMAIKAARAGLQVLGSVSAPTVLGIRLLDRLGVTLVAFTRPPRFTVYTHPERVLIHGEPLQGLPSLEEEA